MAARSEPATANRLKQARESGDMPSLPQLSQALVLTACACVLPYGARAVAAHSADQLKAAFQNGNIDAISLHASVASSLAALAAYSTPPLAIAVLARLVAQLIETRLGGSASSSTSKRTRAFGFRNPLSWQGTLNSAAAWLVAAALLTYAVLWLRHNAALIASTLGSVPTGLHLLEAALVKLLWFSCALWAAVATLGLAFSYQLWKWRNRMSRQDRRQEQKETEGDPHFSAERARLRTQQLQESARLDLEGATLVVHHADRIAAILKYDASSAAPPMVVGIVQSNQLASILAEAERLRVPTVEHPSLARSLANGTVGQPIAEKHYADVALLLADAVSSSAIH